MKIIDKNYKEEEKKEDKSAIFFTDFLFFIIFSFLFFPLCSFCFLFSSF